MILWRLGNYLYNSYLNVGKDRFSSTTFPRIMNSVAPDFSLYLRYNPSKLPSIWVTTLEQVEVILKEKNIRVLHLVCNITTALDPKIDPAELTDATFAIHGPQEPPSILLTASEIPRMKRRGVPTKIALHEDAHSAWKAFGKEAITIKSATELRESILQFVEEVLGENRSATILQFPPKAA